MRAVTIVMCLAVMTSGSLAGAETLGTDNLARAEAMLVKGERALELGDFQRAEDLFTRATRLTPDLPSAQLGLGAALVGQRRYQEALTALDAAERGFVGLHEAHRLAMLRIQQANDDARLKVSGLEDDHSVGHMIPNWQGMENDQIEKLNAAQGPPVPAQLRYLQGIARLRTGDQETGVELLRECLAIDPGHPLGNYNLAVALLASGERHEAEYHLQQAVASGVVIPPSLVERLGSNSVRASSVD